MPRTVTDVPFGLRLLVALTESFGRLAATTVVVGATLTVLELVVLATAAVVVELETDAAATVVATTVGDAVAEVSAVSTASIVVVTVVTNVSLAQLEIANIGNKADTT